MFEGVSEQLELLAEDAVETLEDKPAFPAKELLPAKVSGKKGAAVTRPRKNPEKKNRKGDTLRWLMMQLPQMLIRQRIP